MTAKSPTILDCTLRDGGYYNAWDFSPELVGELLAALDRSGVDIVELGYKSVRREGFYGLYRYCAEGQLGFLRDHPRLAFAFMLDTKEFLDERDCLVETRVTECVPPQSASAFSWVRIATIHDHVRQSVELAGLLARLGYGVTLNLMGISLLSEAEIVADLGTLAGSAVGVFYFADSYGNFAPDFVARLLGLVRDNTDRKVGIHTHDNQGLAFANTMVAVAAGVDFVDATVAGMGRGAGNLRLEQLLLALYFRHGRSDLDPYALVDVCEHHMRPLQQRYEWGWDFTYMLAGLENIHPTYCQHLRASHQYTMGQVARILSSIPLDARRKFSGPRLLEATSAVIEGSRDVEGPAPPAFGGMTAETVLLVARGASVATHNEALRAFIDQHQPAVLECNDTGALAGVRRRIAALNEVRLVELAPRLVDPEVIEVVTGLARVPAGLDPEKLRGVPYHVAQHEFGWQEAVLTIPGFLVGMFAMGIALASTPARIYLAGFDGYAGAAVEQREMQEFWDLVRRLAPQTAITALLPTTYDLPVTSLYALIR